MKTSSSWDSWSVALFWRQVGTAAREGAPLWSFSFPLRKESGVETLPKPLWSAAFQRRFLFRGSRRVPKAAGIHPRFLFAGRAAAQKKAALKRRTPKR
jgi:hypothetical protein